MRGRRQRRHAVGFRRDRPSAERCDSIVAAPFVVGVRRRPPQGFDDESIVEQAREEAIERTGLELDAAARARRGLAHDGVAVSLTVQEHEEDVERIGFERKEVFRSALG